MTITLKLVDFQKAQAEIQKAMGQLVTDNFVTVGIHESAPEVEGGAMTMAALGALQHFGSEDGKIPARRWLDVGVESGNQEYIETLADGIRANVPPIKVLQQVGELAVGYTQAYVDELKTPRNADSTIAKKGVDNPLVDTGAMKQSITSLLTAKKPEEGL